MQIKAAINKLRTAKTDRMSPDLLIIIINLLCGAVPADACWWAGAGCGCDGSSLWLWL
jgi:hypothetical protein